MILPPRVKRTFLWLCAAAGAVFGCLSIRGLFFVGDTLYISTAGDLRLGESGQIPISNASGGLDYISCRFLEHSGDTVYWICSDGLTFTIIRDHSPRQRSLAIFDDMRTHVTPYCAWIRRVSRPVTDRVGGGVHLFDEGYGVRAFGAFVGVTPSSAAQAARGDSSTTISLPLPLLAVVGFVPLLIFSWRRRREARRRGFVVEGPPPADAAGDPPAAA